MFLVLFFVGISVLSAPSHSSEEMTSVDELKIHFFDTVTYEFVQDPAVYNPPEMKLTDPIYLDKREEPFLKCILSDEDFKTQVWFIQYHDNYAEASYVLYEKLKGAGAFTFENVREFYWSIMATPRSDITSFAKKIYEQLKNSKVIFGSIRDTDYL
ncbi:hypothetical protein [Candidatus Paracaedibacter symbiosus]|uniref:hypothetical protein n=1 Tax=Candidatus Paracaedibacter symbiosus TaxID=244582 RepID=UPI0005094118|nr:hypothetical protein [Candidatus Paracaedibacter symbiosus]